MKIKFPLVFLALVILINLLVLTKLVFFPYPELFVYPYLANHGLLPYRQIFDQHFPSLLMMPINFSTFGLNSPFSARIFLLATAALSDVLIYLIGLKIFKKPFLALAANFVYLIIQPLFEGYILWLDSFLAPILLISFYFLIRFIENEKKFDGFWAGLFLGLSLSFKQVMAPMVLAAVLYIFFKKRSLKFLISPLVGLALPLIATLVWIIKQGILKDFIYWTAVFNFEVYAKMGRKLPSFSQLARVLVYFLPALYFVWLKFKKRADILVLGLFVFFSSATAVSRFEFVHLQPAIPFVALGTIGFFKATSGKIKTLLSGVLILATLVWLPVFYKSHISRLVYFFDANTLATASKISRLTKNTDRIFVLGAQPVIYPLADRLPAGRVFSASVPWNMAVVEDKILARLESDRPTLIVRDASATIDERRVIDFESKLNKFVEENYKKIDQIGVNEILVPKIGIKK